MSTCDKLTQNLKELSVHQETEIRKLRAEVERLRKAGAIKTIFNTNTQTFRSVDEAKRYCEREDLCHNDFLDVIMDNNALRAEIKKLRNTVINFQERYSACLAENERLREALETIAGMEIQFASKFATKALKGDDE